MNIIMHKRSLLSKSNDEQIIKWRRNGISIFASKKDAESFSEEELPEEELQEEEQPEELPEELPEEPLEEPLEELLKELPEEQINPPEKTEKTEIK